MSKVCALGEKNFVVPFKAVGATLYPVESREEALKALEEIASEPEPVALIISEKFAKECTREIMQFREAKRGVVLALSAREGTPSADFEELRFYVTRAAGVDLLGRGSRDEP